MTSGRPSACHRSNYDDAGVVHEFAPGEPFLTDGTSAKDRAVLAAGETLTSVFEALSRHDWNELVGYARLTREAGPSVDPGWYRDHADNLGVNQRLLVATAEYVARLREITR